jgi:hypothetical protein
MEVGHGVFPSVRPAPTGTRSSCRRR